MKLKNKLLPIFGIAAATATVIPLVTSCKLSKVEMVDITKGYYPTTKSSVAGELTQQIATQTYINDVKTNSDIFRQDFLYGVYTKVNELGREFESMPSTSDVLSAAKFKINSLIAGTSTPTFSHTTITYPQEPQVTYPTVSFEYTVKLNYTYEYLASNEYVPCEEYGWGEEGYHKRTNDMTINVKYVNVPFLAVAHSDDASRTYWQVTPIDTIAIDNTYSTSYYNQAYMFEYMDDPWSIYINSTTNTTEKYTLSGGDTGTITSDVDVSKNISTWNQLEEYVLNSTESNNEDVVSYEQMLISQANFGFASWYLQNVKQKPELQTIGQMYHTIGREQYKTPGNYLINSLYLPQTFTGKIELFGNFDEATEKPSGAIVLNNLDNGDGADLTLTIAEGCELTVSNNWCNIPATYAIVKAPEEWSLSYNFQLPKIIYAQFTPSSGTAWVQKVYLNQDSLGGMNLYYSERE